MAWDLLRNALVRDPESHEHRVAASLDEVVDDSYRWVAQPPTAGAARLARFAACALVAPDLLDEDAPNLFAEPRREIPQFLIAARFDLAKATQRLEHLRLVSVDRSPVDLGFATGAQAIVSEVE